MIFIISASAIVMEITVKQQEVEDRVKVPKQKIVTSLPDYSKCNSPEEKVELFLNFIEPIIESENSYILRDRAKLLKLIDKKKYSKTEIDWLRKKAEFYKLRNFSHESNRNLNDLKSRMDIIPKLMVISQAAIESGYGTSGFARRGKNLFGMRTTTKSKGLKPKGLSPNTKIYVRNYDSYNESIKYYLRNLNTHRAYRLLRKTRAELRKRDKPLDAYKFVYGLKKYSTEGDVYVAKIKRTIKKHEKIITENI